MLAVDIGNTFARVVLFKGEEIVERRSFHTRDLQLDELRVLFSELAPRSPMQTVWVASVAPQANAVVDSAAERAGLMRRFIRPGLDPIILHSLKTPKTTGVDRLLAAMAAGRRFFPGAGGGRGYVTIQCGSAVTVDYVDGLGIFRGGYILPGPTMWLGGLATAAQLPDLSAELVDWTAVTIGDNTRDAMLSGMAAALPMAVVSAAMMVDVVPGDAHDMSRAGPPVAVTGGWGEAVSHHFPVHFVYDRDLVLHGIRLFAEREEGL